MDPSEEIRIEREYEYLVEKVLRNEFAKKLGIREHLWDDLRSCMGMKVPEAVSGLNPAFNEKQRENYIYKTIKNAGVDFLRELAGAKVSLLNLDTPFLDGITGRDSEAREALKFGGILGSDGVRRNTNFLKYHKAGFKKRIPGATKRLPRAVFVFIESEQDEHAEHGDYFPDPTDPDPPCGMIRPLDRQTVARWVKSHRLASPEIDTCPELDVWFEDGNFLSVPGIIVECDAPERIRAPKPVSLDALRQMLPDLEEGEWKLLEYLHNSGELCGDAPGGVRHGAWTRAEKNLGAPRNSLNKRWLRFAGSIYRAKK